MLLSPWWVWGCSLRTIVVPLDDPAPLQLSLQLQQTLKVCLWLHLAPGWGNTCSVAIGQGITLFFQHPWSSFTSSWAKSSATFRLCLKAWRALCVPSTPHHTCASPGLLSAHLHRCHFNRCGSPSVSSPRTESGKKRLHSHLYLLKYLYSPFWEESSGQTPDCLFPLSLSPFPPQSTWGG